MTEYNLFCYAEDKKKDGFQCPRYRVFNKEVGEERYGEVKNLIKDDILKYLKLELDKNNWKEEWKKVTNDQWQRMKDEIPEFDQEVVEKIVEFKLKLEDSEEKSDNIIEVNGVKYKRK